MNNGDTSAWFQPFSDTNYGILNARNGFCIAWAFFLGGHILLRFVFIRGVFKISIDSLLCVYYHSLGLE